MLTNCAVLTEGYDNPALDCKKQRTPQKKRLSAEYGVYDVTLTKGEASDLLAQIFANKGQ